MLTYERRCEYRRRIDPAERWWLPAPLDRDPPDGGMMTTEPVGARTIGASEFKVRCRELVDQIAAGCQELVITRHGQPVLRLLPYRKRPETLFGIDHGRFEIVGNVGEPIDVEWEAEAGRDRDQPFRYPSAHRSLAMGRGVGWRSCRSSRCRRPCWWPGRPCIRWRWDPRR